MRFKELVGYVRRKRDFLTFLFSLILILVVPITTFSLFYLNYFQKSYTDKLLQLAESACSRSQIYFDQTIRQCDQIAGILQDDALFSMDRPGRQPSRWNEITAELDNTRQLNSALVDVVYQRADSDVIFTCSGPVYNPVYTEEKQYRFNVIPESPGFYRRAFLGNGPATTRPVIAYSIPISDGEGILSFWLDAEQMLPTLLDDGQRFSIMLVDGDITVWQPANLDASDFSGESLGSAGVFDLYETSSGQYYLNVQPAGDISANIYFILPYDMVMGESNAMSGAFATLVVIEACLCIVLIIYLARRSYRPIQELYGSVLEFVPELLPPANTSELAAAEYALRQLSDREKALQADQKSYQQQKLLHRLFTGSLRDTAALAEAGIRLESGKCAAAVLFSLREGFPDGAFPSLMSELDEHFHRTGHVVYNTEYIENRSRIYLVTLGSSEDPTVLLDSFAQNMAKKWGRIFYFSCGNAVSDLSEVWCSYCEAVSARSGAEDDSLICTCNCARGGDTLDTVYPKEELEGLQNAIAAGNSERIQFLTDSLLRQIEVSDGRFLSRVLAYAATVILADALDADEAARVFRQPPYQSYEDVRNLVTDLAQKVVERIHTESDARQEQDGFEQILVYIRDNIDNPELSVSMIGDAMHIHPNALGKLFHDRTGTTISDYMRVMRHEHIKLLLLTTDLPVSEIARRMGYSQTSSFIRRFKSIEGITPGDFRLQYR